MSQSSCRRFTLIELLVVIAIISILASLLLPMLGKARDSARKAVCRGNLSQIGMATFMYLDDNDGTFMRQGFYRYGVNGHFAKNEAVDGWSRYDIWNFYSSYLGGKLEIDKSNASYYMSNGLWYRPSKALVCPNNTRSSWWKNSYGFFTGSANNCRFTLNNLTAVASKVSSQTKMGDTAALWGDITFALTQGDYALTNHKSSANADGIEGGNVYQTDGSVTWFPYLPYSWPSNWPQRPQTYMYWGGTATSAPTNAIYPSYGTSGNISATDGNSLYIGVTRTYATNYFTIK